MGGGNRHRRASDEKTPALPNSKDQRWLQKRMPRGGFTEKHTLTDKYNTLHNKTLASTSLYFTQQDTRLYFSEAPQKIARTSSYNYPRLHFGLIFFGSKDLRDIYCPGGFVRFLKITGA